MVWTNKHSANALAAKARQRIGRAAPPPAGGPRRKLWQPRTRARFRLTLRDLHLGDSLTLTLTELPWPGRFVTGAGEAISTAQILRALKHALNFRQEDGWTKIPAGRRNQPASRGRSPRKCEA